VTLSKRPIKHHFSKGDKNMTIFRTHRWLLICGILLAVAVMLLAETGKEALPPVDKPPTKGELELMPLLTDVPGELPANGMRYWQTPFRSIDAIGAYASVTVRKGNYELWCNDATGDPTLPASTNHINVRRGKAIDKLEPRQNVLDTSIVNDVFDPKKPDELAFARLFTRTFVTYDSKAGYVLFACVPPTYSPGAVQMLPTITVSSTGTPDSWSYKGKLTGEPLTEAAKRNIWCDGGSIFRMPNGHWRAYVNGFGTAMACLEAEKLEGPWAFRRDDTGKICEMLTDFPNTGRYGGCFPTVLRVSNKEWHAWISDTWPPQAIWHFCSKDGLKWNRYGVQPEITRAAFDGHAIKCLRAYLDPKTHKITGLLSVMNYVREGQEDWLLHTSTMPTGLRKEGK
jgi:hypothetical protein